MSSPGTIHLVPEGERAERIETPAGEVVAFRLRGPEREVSEDFAAVVPTSDGALLIVADGMGGQSAGARASRLTVESVVARVVEADREGIALRHATLDGIEAANRAVRALGLGAGATFAGIALRAGRARAIHVGDSVVLHVGQRGRVKVQTIPHSPTGYLVEAGLLDEDEALRHEERHLITNYVGHEGMRIEVGSAVRVMPRDTLVVASDGLADNLTVEEIVDLARKGPLLVAGERLAELARRRMEQPEPGAPSKPDDLTFLLFRPAAGRGHRE